MTQASSAIIQLSTSSDVKSILSQELAPEQARLISFMYCFSSHDPQNKCVNFCSHHSKNLMTVFSLRVVGHRRNMEMIFTDE